MQRDEFEMHFQPQVDLETGRVFAAEALIRWHHDGEIITPTELIHIAEETGLIVSLGEWALRESCAQAARWRAAGHALSVAVNLSPQQLLREGFADLARRVLDETQLPPSSLEMEITEGMLMMRSPENIAMLERLAGMGIRLAIDDFGTGYSSLAYLQRFPVKGVKIDQSFIAGIGDDVNDTAIVTAIIAMAHSLRLKVVAEGVETARQVTFLKAHGCLAAQGHYFSPAVPASQFIELLSRPLWPEMNHPADNLAPPSAWGQHRD
jgi:EAL domain-containing protein (putative c-di-GMP-specific phosphodiesterase class I)